MENRGMNTEIQPIAGVGVRNRKGDVVFWVRDKYPTGGPHFVLLMYRRDQADEDQKKGLDLCYMSLIEMSRKDGVPVYDYDEIFDELGGAYGPGVTESINILVTDLVRKEKDLLKLRLTPPDNDGDEVRKNGGECS